MRPSQGRRTDARATRSCIQIMRVQVGISSHLQHKTHAESTIAGRARAWFDDEGNGAWRCGTERIRTVRTAVLQYPYRTTPRRDRNTSQAARVTHGADHGISTAVVQ
jgi:hypothetical protein